MKITNELLLEKIEGIHERLDRLNGQTYKNTAFRHKQTIINYVSAAIGGCVLTVAVNLLLGIS